MDIRELIILGGGALIGLVVLYAIWVAWRRHHSPLRMKIEPDLAPEGDADDWLNGELPNGGARMSASGGDNAKEPRDEPWIGPAPTTAQHQQDIAQPRAEQARDEPLKPTAEETVGTEEKMEVLVIHVLASGGNPFAGGSLLGAMRSQGLQYGDMQIFHRMDPQTQQPIFSVANAVEPGYFNLDEDCASLGLTAFLKLPGPKDADAALEDMLATTAAIADALGGVRLDGDRAPFTDEAASAYRARTAEFARRWRGP